MRVGIIGYGSAGRSIAKGLAGAAAITHVAATTRTLQSFVPESHVSRSESNALLAGASDIVVIAVKPWQVRGVLEEIAPHVSGVRAVVSVAAAVSSDDLRCWLKRGVVRAMPNLPCRIREGLTVVARDERLAESERRIASDLFRTLGRVVVLDEALMDAATAIGGCGPAYAYLIIEALVDAAVKLGLPRPVALEMVAQTFAGAARTVLEGGAHPAALRDEVTTPGGCTVHGLAELEAGNIRATLARAAAAAAARSAELRTSGMMQAR